MTHKQTPSSTSAAVVGNNRSTLVLALALALALAIVPLSGLAQLANEKRSEPEVVLTLSLELSTDKSNTGAIVGRVVRTDWLASGDQAEAMARASQLRREISAKYSAPTRRAGFQLVTHEVKYAEVFQYITDSQRFKSTQGSYRNLWSRTAPYGLWGVGFAFEEYQLNAETASAPFIADYIKRNGERTHMLPLLAYWAFDRRVGGQILPQGHFDQLLVEVSPLSSGMRYSKFDVYHESYWRLGPTLSAGFNAALGAVQSVGGAYSPLAKRYFGGGVGDVRGYTAGALGPVDSSGAATGANRKATLAAEISWQAFEVSEMPILLSAFYDIGRFSGADFATSDGQTAKSVGIGVSLPARIGLMKLSFARPLTDNLRTQHFQFEARANWK